MITTPQKLFNNSDDYNSDNELDPEELENDDEDQIQDINADIEISSDEDNNDNDVKDKITIPESKQLYVNKLLINSIAYNKMKLAVLLFNLESPENYFIKPDEFNFKVNQYFNYI